MSCVSLVVYHMIRGKISRNKYLSVSTLYDSQLPVNKRRLVTNKTKWKRREEMNVENDVGSLQVTISLCLTVDKHHDT